MATTTQQTRPQQQGAGPADRSSEPPRGPVAPKMPPRRAWLVFLLILAANFLLMRLLFPRVEPVKVPYTLFKQEVAKGNVERIYSRGESITGRFESPVTFPAAPDSVTGATPHPVTDFATTLPAFVDPGLESLLIANGVEIDAEPIQQGSTWLGLLFSFAPALLLIGMYVWFFRRAARQGGMGGLMGIGRSTARRFDTQTDTRVTFDDVAGIDEAENEL
ncbi:MAG TPA: ATP-dependent metallopeptidase FtsH/Yme1/Tma family protein, partial [Gemmatimonadaceae bacterium]|nr:ATP-dependent metallopeptidase FtsH/Yme1/Tma family protein [Gemmatimonadaceae bacterium]